MNLRTGLVVVGSVLVTLGGILSSFPSLNTFLSRDASIKAAVAVFVTIGLATSGLLVLSASILSDHSDTPTPEHPDSASLLGVEIDHFYESRMAINLQTSAERTSLHTELQNTALQTIMRCSQCSRAHAQHQLEAGSWTDDTVAATFLSPTEPAHYERTRVPVWRAYLFRNGVLHSVDALVAYSDQDQL